MTGTAKLTPDDVRQVPCPVCGVDATERCSGVRYPSSHQERVWRVREHLCGKTIYRSRKFAVQVAHRQSRHTGTVIEAYKCLLCHGWHTGHPRRTSRGQH